MLTCIVFFYVYLCFLGAFGDHFGSPGRPISQVFSLNFVGALRRAFWIPFGHLLGAFWYLLVAFSVPFGRLGDIFGRLFINFSCFGDVCWVSLASFFNIS